MCFIDHDFSITTAAGVLNWYRYCLDCNVSISEFCKFDSQKHTYYRRESCLFGGGCVARTVTNINFYFMLNTAGCGFGSILRDMIAHRHSTWVGMTSTLLLFCSASAELP